jgi:Lrp/AsnC family leucine-responsive transcriptional regulator
MKNKLDVLDLKILDIVQKNNRMPTEKIAKKVSLSPSAVQRRLEQLRLAGVIQQDVAVISPETVGCKLMAIVAVTLEQERPDIVDRFRRTMIDAPEVLQCYNVTGEADFMIVMAVKDMEEFEIFSLHYFSENPHVRRFQTNVVVRTVKYGLAVPLRLTS